MANYTKTTDFAAKDTLPGGDANKVVRGAEFETEFDAISTAIATKADTASPTFTGTVTIPTADINGGNIDGAAIGASSASTGNFTTLSINGTAVTSTAAELNILDGVTASAAELNLLDGVTSTTAELNILGGVTATALELNALDGITASTAELNILSGVTSSTAELNLLDGVTASTSEINHLDGVTSNIQTQLDAVGTDGLPTQTGNSGYYLTTDGTSASWDNLKDGPTFTGTVTFSGTGATTLPSGTTAQRPTAAQGMVRFNTTTNGFEGYNGSAWGALGAEFAYTRTSATATASQTTFSATYTAGYVDVYLNGVKLVSGTDFTATDGTSVVLTTGATVGDSVEILAYETFSVANAMLAGNNLSDLSSPSTAITNLGITSTAAELNVLDGITATTAELNILDGVTSTAAELNILDGVTATTAELNILDGVTATTAELNILDGVTATTAELNYVDGVTSNIQTQIDNINPSPTLNATASGALANGDTVIVNSDGTVSVVAETISDTPSAGTPAVFESATSTYTSAAYDANAQKVVIAYSDGGNSSYGTAVVGTVSGTSISFGSPVVFESANTIYISAAYDANAQKVVIAYRDQGNSDYGTAVVGTVSGTSISFGTAVVFESAGILYTSAAYDANAQKVVIVYRDAANSNYGTAIVGTVSGTSISFGTAVVFESATSNYTSVTYDANAQKVVIAYQDNANSNYGTAVVGTVSGTSISFGTPTVFESANTIYISAAYDANAQKVVIAYNDGGNSDYGTAVVGTVSGTSISFGTPAVFKSANSTFMSAAYDANAQKVVIAYRDSGNSNYGTAILGTVSGTSISFGSPLVFESASSSFMSAAYDANVQKVVIAYRDSGNSNYGTAIVFSSQSIVTNLTAENYIGISDAAYADAATATIQIVGSVDDAQSGLTAGQQYFVQTDGTLGLTAGEPSVVAGTAVSSTKIIVKG